METKSVRECNGLSIGEIVDEFNGIDQNGNEIRLSELLKKGKVVVVFYRGQWCPICMPHLRKLQKSLEEIEKKGASLLVITPEKQENIKKTLLKTSITVPVLYDKNYKIMKQFDLAFIPGKGLRFLYNALLGANLKNAHSDDSETLPIPATFIIDSDGKVIWRHFNRDYKQRSKVQEILDQL